MYVIGGKDYQQELDYLSIVLKEIQDTAKDCDDRSESFGKQFGFNEKNEHMSPLCSTVPFELAFKEAAARIVSWAISKWHKELCPNVKLEKNDVVSFKNNFLFVDIRKVFDSFGNVYVGNAMELSKENILKEARKLLQFKWVNSERVMPEVSEILKGKKLQLYLYRDNYDKDDKVFYKKEVQALLKLANVVLSDDNPVTVTDEIKLMDFKWFKNGRLDAIFDSDDDAKQVADVLINGFKK